MPLIFDHYTDAAAFYGATGAFLNEHEVENNLSIGIVLNALHGHAPTSLHLWRAREGETIVGAAVLSAARGVVLVTPAARIAAALADELHARRLSVPFVQGQPEDCALFIERWQALTGERAVLRQPQLLYRLDTVIPVQGVRGELRRAGHDDSALLTQWIRGFFQDAFGYASPTAAEDHVRRWLPAPEPRGIWLWDDDGRPVSTGSVYRLTPHGAVLSLVYTPPEARRRGYAAALTAAVSAHMLASGRRWCALYTDRANPTSNHIYQTIGYRLVGPQEDWALGSG